MLTVMRLGGEFLAGDELARHFSECDKEVLFEL